MATKDHQQPHHLSQDAAAPVVHQHPDETVLARWLRLAIEKGPGAWLPWVAGIGLAAAAIAALVNFANRPPEGQKAWSDLMVPSLPADPQAVAAYEKLPQRVRPLLYVADTHAGTNAGNWARLRAGLSLYEEALRDLPNQRETGRPLLEEAIKQFDAVLAAAPAASPEAESAAMGKARALESRGELEKAITQYEEVASKFPGTPSAKLATDRAKLLLTPEAQDFYQNFYNQDFTKITSSSGGLTPGGIPRFPGMNGGQGSPLFGEPVIPGLPTTPIAPPSGGLQLGDPPASTSIPAPGDETPSPAPPLGEPALPTPPAESSTPTLDPPTSPSTPPPAP